MKHTENLEYLYFPTYSKMLVKHEYEEKSSFQTCSQKFKHGGKIFKHSGLPVENPGFVQI